MIFALEQGELRICRMNPTNESDFSDYWSLTMHDNNNGHVSNIRLSYDNKTLITSGYDGNLFSYVINDDDSHIMEVQIPEIKTNYDRVCIILSYYFTINYLFLLKG